MKMRRFWWAVIIVLALVASGAGFFVWRKSQSNENIAVHTSNSNQSEEGGAAIAAGKQLSNNKCKGEGPGVLTHLPMDQDDYAMILPYGLVIDGHVTPIDHQYFSPMVFNSPRDTYPVYAMADATVTDIQPRTNDRGTEYRFVFSVSCTFLYYYDLVTSLTPDIKAHYDKRDFNFAVKAGDLVGKIGGQTLDFAVWDTTKPLKGFVNPKSYEGEAWKIYTADPLDYYSPEVKAKALSKYIRTTAPLSGRIDFDIDGKLIGNWFEKDSGGYAAPSRERNSYWSGHLSIAPDYIDNTATIVSFGSWNGGEAKQFMAKEPTDPATVGVDTGLVKYELYGYHYRKTDGQTWDAMSLTQDPKQKIDNGELGGCVLVQLAELRLLKVEQFAGKKCTDVSAFTALVKVYER